MIRALIIEDEAYIRKAIVKLLETFNNRIEIIGECESVNEAVVVINATKPDLLFLDINLVGGTGFEVLEQTTHLNYNLIFITAFEEFALKAIKNGALDYLLKPIDKDEFQQAIAKLDRINQPLDKEQLQVAVNHWNDKASRMILRMQESFQIINFAELKYCKSDGSYTTFFMSDGREFTASKPIKEYEKQLPSSSFIRTHQSYIVNLRFVDKYDKSRYVILKGNSKVPVSTRKKEEFVNRLTKPF